jgi:GDSL-like Lipase/Acylhydrolase family
MRLAGFLVFSFAGFLAFAAAGYLQWLHRREIRTLRSEVFAHLTGQDYLEEQLQVPPRIRYEHSGMLDSLLNIVFAERAVRTGRDASTGPQDSRQRAFGTNLPRASSETPTGAVWAFFAGLTLLLLAWLSLVLPSEASAEIPDSPADERSDVAVDFEWWTNERHDDLDQDGLRDFEDADTLNPEYLQAVFSSVDVDCEHAQSVIWRIDGQLSSNDCQFSKDFPEEGEHRVSLTITDSQGRIGSTEKDVVIQDWLIVSLGDSVASGEGSPPWTNRKCHRSEASGPSQAVRLLQVTDPHTTVSFLHLACTGATITEGLLGEHRGMKTQVEDVARFVDRQIDAVLLSVGANDIGFSKIVVWCATLPSCWESGKVQAYVDRIASLDDHYQSLAACLESLPTQCRLDSDDRNWPGLALSSSSPVLVTEYFDPTRDERGRTCDRILVGISQTELEWAQQHVIDPLNSTIHGSARDLNWWYVGGIAALFREHGFCAEEPWIVRPAKALARFWPNALGILHPNRKGQLAYAVQIWTALRSNLYPNGVPRYP